MDEVIALKNPIKDWARKIREWGRICWCYHYIKLLCYSC
jgi:hypothetical protein